MRFTFGSEPSCFASGFSPPATGCSHSTVGPPAIANTLFLSGLINWVVAELCCFMNCLMFNCEAVVRFVLLAISKVSFSLFGF